MGAKRIFLYHGEAYGNLGDEAMLLNAIRRIRAEVGEDTEFVVPKKKSAPLPDALAQAVGASSLAETGRIIEIPSVGDFTARMAKGLIPHNRLRHKITSRWRNPVATFIRKSMLGPTAAGPWRALLRALDSCDAVYMVGGANLNDLAGYVCLLPKCMLGDAATKRGLPIVVSAQTVGPLRLSWTRGLVARLIEQSASFTTRDGGITLQQLQAAGIDTTNVTTTGDEAHSFPAAAESAGRAYLEAAGVDADSPFGVLHFRSTDYTGKTASRYELLARAFDRATLRCPAVFLPMSYHLHDDEKCGHEIRGLMKHPEKLIVLPCPHDVSLAKRVVSMGRWSLALSYHVQVFAFGAGRPVGLLSSGAYYDIKARGMRMMLGQSTPFIDLGTIGPEGLAASIEKLDGEPAGMIAEIEAARATIDGVCDDPPAALARALGIPAKARSVVDAKPAAAVHA